MKDQQPQPRVLVEFGPFRFHKTLGELSKGGIPIRLRGMPLKILQHLVERPGEIVSRRELQEVLWKGTAFGDFEQGLNSAVNVVRNTLSDSADHPRYIETVPGNGYRFIAALRSVSPVMEAFTLSGVAAPDSTEDADQALESERIGEAAVTLKATVKKPRWWIAAAFAIPVLSVSLWSIFHERPQLLMDGSAPSANREANDQYNLAVNFLTFQNDIPRAQKTFERALELDPHFGSAHLQRALGIIIEIHNGYANDGSALYQAEDDLHQAEQTLPGSDGLLLATQAGVYLAQGRLDRVPWAKLEEEWRPGGNPVWLVILRMLKEQQTEESVAVLRTHLERNPLENPVRMFLGELLRTQGDTAGAVDALRRVIEQGPGHPTAAWFLTMAYLDEGKPEQARTLLEGMRPGFEKNYMWRHAWAILLAAEGNHKEALEAMDDGTLQYARLAWAVTSATADFYALQGDHSKAMEWLQLAISRGDERVAYFRRNPRLATLRNYPQFQSMLKSVEARRK